MANILVIEDELEKPLELNKFITDLQAKKHILEYAESGDEAIDKLSEKKYDIVLLDIMMRPTLEEPIKHAKLCGIPRPDVGVTILELIFSGNFSENGVSKDAPIIVISAVTGGDRWKKIRTYVPEERIIAKPCSPEEIVKKIDETLKSIGSSQ